MPKKTRSPEEVEAFKLKIQAQALSIISEDGFDGLSMRKLARRLGIAAVTIYNYFENKDEIYLAILTKGFEHLYAESDKAFKSTSDPLLRLEAMVRAYVDFGFDQHNFYDLMFTSRVPKYRDYVDTPLIESAKKELEASQKVYTLFVDAVIELTNNIGKTIPDPDILNSITEKEIRFLVITFWCTLHGYISGCSNTLLNYMHEAPETLKDPIIKLAFHNIHHEMNELKAGRSGSFSALALLS